MTRKHAHQCHICTKSFAAVQGLNAHLWTQHQHISLERKYVFSDTCLACGRCFWTPQRMQQHLRYSRHYEGGCLEFLVQHYSPLDQPVRFDIPDPHAHVHRLPWVFAEGAIPEQGATVWDAQQSHRLNQVRAQWIASGFPEALEPDLKASVFQALTDVTTAWTLHPEDSEILVHDWLYRIDSFDQESEDIGLQAQWAFLEWGQTAMYDLLDTLEDPDLVVTIDKSFLSLCDQMPLWPLLQEFDRIRHAYPPAGPNLDVPQPTIDTRVRVPLEPFPDSIRDQGQLLFAYSGLQPLQWPPIHGVPVLQFSDGRKAIVVFHLFSGRRREHDCHDWFHSLISSFFAGVDVIVCSIDTAVDPQLCDLAQGPHLQSIFHLARRGVPALCGPPCETWTAARHLQPPEGSQLRWPRPLRSAQQPWGIPHPCREFAQLSTGTQLMMTSNRIELLVYLGGGGSVKEHPAEPRAQEYASIWRTNLHKNVLLAAPSAKLIYVEQWQYGADAVKPTQLSVPGLPDAQRKLRACIQGDAVRPEHVLQGVDTSTGQFKTAKAKEYPAGFCKALVSTSLSSLRQRVAAEGWNVIPSSQLGERELWWLESVANAGKRCSATNFLPDYQPAPV